MPNPVPGAGRGIAAAALVVAAAALAVTAGHVGLGNRERGVVTVALCLTACGLLAGVVPPLVLRGRSAGFIATYLLLALAPCTAFLAVADQEARFGRWADVTVKEARCVRTDGGGCNDTYHVSDAATERDYGWLLCDGAGYQPGDRARVRLDPADRWRPSLDPCAYTSPGWSTALSIALGAYGIAALGVLVTPVAQARHDRRHDRRHRY